MREKQSWKVGNWVKVGFLRLKILELDGDWYILGSAKGIRYAFTPYHGIVKLG